MRAVIYARYSHQKQDKSFSIEEQIAACRQKAAYEKYEIVEVFSERATSAKDLNRPVLASLINFVCSKKNNVDAIYCYDISRLSRNAVDLGLIKRDLSKYGIVIRSVNGVPDDTLEGNMMQDVIARFAQYENELKSVKVKGGMYNRFLAGYALHSVKGYKWGIDEYSRKMIIPDEAFDIYQNLWHKIRDEKLSIINAVKYHNKLHPNLKLTISSLSRMLANKIYYGVLSYPKYKEEIKGRHTAMIDEDTFWQVRAIITGRSHKNVKTRNKVNPLYPLTKSLLCVVCDAKTTAARSKGKLKHYEYYFCRKRGSCKYNVQVDDVHEAFKKKLRELIPTDDMMQFLKEMITEKYEAHFNDLSASTHDVEKELTELEKKKRTLLDKLLDGTISDEVYKGAEIKLNSEIIARKTLISEKQIDKLDIETVLNFVFYYMKNLDKIWERYPVEVQIALQCSTLPLGVYYENGVCRTPEISLAFKSKETFDALSDPNVSYVEHLGKVVNDYARIYQVMSPYIKI